MSGLTDFLLARIAEDEAVAREVLEKIKPDLYGHKLYFEAADGSAPSVYWDVDYQQGGFTITAARAMAECEAKRRIVALHSDGNDPGEEPAFCTICEPEGAWDDANHLYPCATVRPLAQPYADHPDFREGWRA